MEPEGACSTCHAGIRNVFTEGGKIRELETDPHADGNYLMVTNGRGEIRARVLGPADMPAPAGQGYRAHRCPPPEPDGPICEACNLPMDRELTAKERWAVHPCCEPEHVDYVLAQRRRRVVRRPARR